MHKFIELRKFQWCVFRTFHVNAACFCLVNHPKTPLHYWFKCARVRHSLCCFPDGVSERHREELCNWEKGWPASGNQTSSEIFRYIPTQTRYPGFSRTARPEMCSTALWVVWWWGGIKTAVSRQETKDGDELHCHDHLQQLSVFLVSALREKFC